MLELVGYEVEVGRLEKLYGEGREGRSCGRETRVEIASSATFAAVDRRGFTLLSGVLEL